MESGLKKYKKKISKLKEEHQLEFNSLYNSYVINKNSELLKELERQSQISKLKFAAEIIYLSLTTVESSAGFNYTLLADNRYNLLKWKDLNESKNILQRLKYYPMINPENGSLAFVRLAGTRISYYCRSYEFSYRKINDVYVFITILFPIENTKSINLQFKIEYLDNNFKNNICMLSYYFNGTNCKRIHEEYSSLKCKSKIKKKILNSVESEKQFLKEYFKEVDMQTCENPIDNLVEGRRFKIYIIQHLENPIIVIEKLW